MTAAKALVPLSMREGAISGRGQVRIGPDPHSLRSIPATPFIASHDFQYPDLHFRIGLFHGSSDSTPAAAALVQRAYARLGYARDECDDIDNLQSSTGVVLQAVQEASMLGTLSVNLASNRRLQAEALYSNEITRFRLREELCEFTRLAVDTTLAGREVLCSLFYMAYVYSHLVHGAKQLFIEVNPRHVRFYERMLGFQQFGPERLCPRVNAPAVLLHLEFEFTSEQIQRSRQGLSVAGTTLYRYAPPLADESRLMKRIEAALS